MNQNSQKKSGWPQVADLEFFEGGANEARKAENRGS